MDLRCQRCGKRFYTATQDLNGSQCTVAGCEGELVAAPPRHLELVP